MADSQISSEVLAEAKRLYEQTLAPVADIALMMGISTTHFYRISRREGWRGRRAKKAAGHFARAISEAGAAALIAMPTAPADQPRAPIEPVPPPATDAQRLLLAQKLQQTIGGQLDAINHINRLVAEQSQLGESARAIAAVSRSLRDTHDLIQPHERDNKPDDSADEPFPYDVEQFRCELARALRAVLDERRGGAAQQSEQPVRQTERPRAREAED